jgi:hypothetical protein
MRGRQAESGARSGEGQRGKVVELKHIRRIDVDDEQTIKMADLHTQ